MELLNIPTKITTVGLAAHLMCTVCTSNRSAKLKKKEKERAGKGGGGESHGGVSRGNEGAAASRLATGKGKKAPKPKMTKDERRAKYTQKSVIRGVNKKYIFNSLQMQHMVN